MKPDADFDAYLAAMTDMVLYRPNTGEGRWSLHAPGSTDEEIASGKGCLVSGYSDMDLYTGVWDRPNYEDYQAAIKQLRKIV